MPNYMYTDAMNKESLDSLRNYMENKITKDQHETNLKLLASRAQILAKTVRDQFFNEGLEVGAKMGASLCTARSCAGHHHKTTLDDCAVAIEISKLKR